MNHVKQILFTLLFSLSAWGNPALLDPPVTHTGNMCHLRDLKRHPRLAEKVSDETVARSRAKEMVTAVHGIRRQVEDLELEQGIRDALEEKIVKAMISGRPVQMLLTCFPGKSPNHLSKTLGPDADMAEEIAVRRLSDMVEKMNSIWPTELVIASDGRMYNQMIDDLSVERYMEGVAQMVTSSNVIVTDANFHFPDMTPHEAREEIVRRYAKTPEQIRWESSDANPDQEQRIAMRERFNEIQKFLKGDASPLDADFYEPGTFVRDPNRPRLILQGHGEKAISRSAKEALIKERAIELIRRSQAFSDALTDNYVKEKGFVRLTVSPSTNVNRIAVNLLDGFGQPYSGTPWHSTIGILPNGHYLVLKRSEAEALGGQLQYKNGRPYAFALPADALDRYHEMKTKQVPPSAASANKGVENTQTAKLFPSKAGLEPNAKPVEAKPTLKIPIRSPVDHADVTNVLGDLPSYANKQNIVLLGNELEESATRSQMLAERLAQLYPTSHIVRTTTDLKPTAVEGNITRMHADNNGRLPFGDNSVGMLVMQGGLNENAGRGSPGKLDVSNSNTVLPFLKEAARVLDKNDPTAGVYFLNNGEGFSPKEETPAKKKPSVGIWMGAAKSLMKDYPQIQVEVIANPDGSFAGVVLRPAIGTEE